MSSYLAAFSRQQVRSTTNQHIVDRDTEGHASELPIQFRDDLAHSLGNASRSGDDVLGISSVITSQLPRGTIHSDGMDCGRESLYEAKVVMDDSGQEAK